MRVPCPAASVSSIISRSLRKWRIGADLSAFLRRSKLDKARGAQATSCGAESRHATPTAKRAATHRHTWPAGGGTASACMPSRFHTSNNGRQSCRNSPAVRGRARSLSLPRRGRKALNGRPGAGVHASHHAYVRTSRSLAGSASAPAARTRLRHCSSRGGDWEERREKSWSPPVSPANAAEGG